MAKHPKYLKKIGDPDHIYHVYTPILAARGDMLPFHPPGEPKEIENLLVHDELLSELNGYRVIQYSLGWYKVVGPDGEDIKSGLRRFDAEDLLMELGNKLTG